MRVRGRVRDRLDSRSGLVGFKPPCSTWLGLGSVRVRVRGRSKPQQDLVGFKLALLHPLRRVVDVACLVLQHLGKKWCVVSSRSSE